MAAHAASHGISVTRRMPASSFLISSSEPSSDFIMSSFPLLDFGTDKDPGELKLPHCQSVPLCQLLKAEKGRYYPLLDHSVQLAIDICDCIYTFHRVGYLHRDLHSMNNLFLPPGKAENTECAKYPRIVGFAGGRENHHDAFTHGPEGLPTLITIRNLFGVRHAIARSLTTI